MSTAGRPTPRAFPASLKTRDRARAPEPGTTAYVKRGGEWLAIFPNFAITFRRFSDGEWRSPDHGFRCAR